ncbi:hypothetical protein TUBRATIS_004100 [Tubulinosema ratisbonensis]|uniref:Uncharacterized protein n=1 Tax=Tubulinosema ratisbonensis TaxID=291195 RepID=A0A437APF3_9MICR|nr:hypothetical protein TUBRATIS_004100 [Tubulinosema ratisbonensis]
MIGLFIILAQCTYTGPESKLIALLLDQSSKRDLANIREILEIQKEVLMVVKALENSYENFLLSHPCKCFRKILCCHYLYGKFHSVMLGLVKKRFGLRNVNWPTITNLEFIDELNELCKQILSKNCIEVFKYLLDEVDSFLERIKQQPEKKWDFKARKTEPEEELLINN